MVNDDNPSNAGDHRAHILSRSDDSFHCGGEITGAVKSDERPPKIQRVEMVFVRSVWGIRHPGFLRFASVHRGDFQSRRLDFLHQLGDDILSDHIDGNFAASIHACNGR